MMISFAVLFMASPILELREIIYCNFTFIHKNLIFTNNHTFDSSCCPFTHSGYSGHLHSPSVYDVPQALEFPAMSQRNVKNLMRICKLESTTCEKLSSLNNESTQLC